MNNHCQPVTAVDPVSAMENDAYLTEHEWLLKEAAAGRAIYIPGWPVDVVKAEIEAMRKDRKTSATKEKKTMITLTLPLDQARNLKKATDNIPSMVYNAANVFKMLWGLTASGFAPSEAELCALYDLCSRGLVSAAEKEGDALDSLDMKLGDALKAFPEGVPS